jgi:predicted O-methyltransferase YrrM
MQNQPTAKPFSQTLAEEDRQIGSQLQRRRFSHQTRPVIRWIKKEAQDDHLVRASIAQATKLFGSSVDYCLCTTEMIDPMRARAILAWSEQPVEWWQVSSADNQVLDQYLTQRGYRSEDFGDWWQYFPERVRPSAPEWIIDSDVVILAKPVWFDAWMKGEDIVRVTDSMRTMVCPPGLTYQTDCLLQLAEIGPTQINTLLAAFREQLLKIFGTKNAILMTKGEVPSEVDISQDLKSAWAIQFSNASGKTSDTFQHLVKENIIFSKVDDGLSQVNIEQLVARFEWLSGGTGQWGVPGWSMRNSYIPVLLQRATAFIGKSVLDLGTSRGRLPAMMSTMGCQVTTVDHQDRGAADNLRGLPVRVVTDDAVSFLERSTEKFDYIVVDLHGNTLENWQRYAQPLLQRLNTGGVMFLDNAILYEMPVFKDEVGVRWFLSQLSADWKVELYKKEPPGFAIVTHLAQN